MRTLRALGACLPLWLMAAPLAAQHGEVQLGAVASYGTPDSFGRGAGVVAGIAIGRLVYVGFRWVHHQGGSHDLAGEADTADVVTRARLFLGDLGLIIPVRGLEVVPGVSLGASRYTQSHSAPRHATEFVIAPGIAVHTYVAGLVLIPEIQYYVCGAPELRWRADHRGAVASLRLVIPIEVGRIRY